MNNTDKHWEFFGRTDPYYGVLTSEQYHRDNLDGGSLAAFFETGQAHVDAVLRVIHTHIDPSFRPASALDFGCGVGRLVIPLAGVCGRVTGVDISSSMLDEARKNCSERGITNVDFVQADDALSNLTGKFDLLHSVIVFQHIPQARGEKIVERLIDRLEEGGIGALHFLYYRQSSALRRIISSMRKASSLFNGLVNVLLRQPLNYPFMQANEYKLERLFQILMQNHCHYAHVQLNVEHVGHTVYFGAMIFFRKEAQTDPRWRPGASG